MLEDFKKLMALPDDDPELISEQFKVFVKQIPMLYSILAVNSLSLSCVYAGAAPAWLSVYAPAALVAMCFARAMTWLSRVEIAVSPEAAFKTMRRAVWFGSALAIVFSTWAYALYGYGNIHAKAELAFFLALTIIACVFCLKHLRPAALIVCALGVVPYLIFFFVADGGRFRGFAVDLGIVAVGVLATVLRNYRDFAGLVASRKELLATHKETLRLSDENLRLANVDPLTGLANRRAFIQELRELTSGEPCDFEEVALAFVDLDGFKNVNDDYGHEVGDALIVGVAEALSEVKPGAGMLARLGGDEFAVVLRGDGAQAQMLAFAERVCARLARPIATGPRAVCVGASVGVSSALTGDCGAPELMRRADVAMYHVKANGKFGFKLYAPDLDQERRRQSAMRDEIRSGLERDEFEVFYQPIVDARSRAITSVEALLRWPRRPGGPIGPDTFIPAAEAEGLIEDLGLFVLRRACADMRRLEAIALSVNVSPAQFRDSDFERKVAAILAETGFPARRLSLEVTEGYLIDNPTRAAAAIEALKAMGISVVLDDFGTGYTSIAYLQKYGFSAIKIDRSIVSKIGADHAARVLLTGVVYLANGLDMPVTAEGVETEDEARLLRLAGCQNLQGFRYSQPKPIEELLAGELAETEAVS